jgi:hypothetical protein
MFHYKVGWVVHGIVAELGCISELNFMSAVATCEEDKRKSAERAERIAAVFSRNLVPFKA